MQRVCDTCQKWKSLKLNENVEANKIGACHEKTDLRVFVVVMPKEGWPRPSFFWYDTDFSEFDSAVIIGYILEKSVSCQKKDGRSHPSFGMTTTKTLSSVFLWRMSILTLWLPHLFQLQTPGSQWWCFGLSVDEWTLLGYLGSVGGHCKRNMEILPFLSHVTGSHRQKKNATWRWQRAHAV